MERIGVLNGYEYYKEEFHSLFCIYHIETKQWRVVDTSMLDLNLMWHLNTKLDNDREKALAKMPKEIYKADWEMVNIDFGYMEGVKCLAQQKRILVKEEGMNHVTIYLHDIQLKEGDELTVTITKKVKVIIEEVQE